MGKTKTVLFLLVSFAGPWCCAFAETVNEEPKSVIASPADKVENNGTSPENSPTSPSTSEQSDQDAKLFAVLDKADASFRKGDVESALNEYRHALKIDRIDLRDMADRYKGTCKTHYDSAVSNLERILETDSTQPGKTHGLLGGFYIRQGKFDLALSHLFQSEEMDEESVDASLRIAQIYLFRKDYKKACEKLKEITEKHPSNSMAWEWFAVAEFKLGHDKKGLRCSEEVLKLDPDNRNAIYNRAIVTRSQQGDSQLVVKDLSRVLDINPQDLKALKARALTYAGLEDYPNSLKDLTQALKVAPNDSWSLRTRADILFREENKYREAIADYTTLIENADASREDYINRAYCAAAAGNLEMFLNDCHSAAKIEILSKTELDTSLYILGCLGESQKVVEQLTELLENDPDNSQLYQFRGYCYTQLKNWEEALKDFQKNNENQENYIVLMCLGLCHGKLESHQKSIEFYTKALDLKNSGDGYAGRGIAYLLLEKYEKAKEDFSKSIEFTPNRKESYLSRGVSNYYLKKYEEAIADLQKAILLLEKSGTQDPSFLYLAHDTLRKIYFAQENTEKTLHHALLTKEALDQWRNARKEGAIK